MHIADNLFGYASYDDRNHDDRIMMAVSSNHCSADAGMRTNNRCSEAETRRNSNGGVIKLQTNIRKWQCVQLISRSWCT